MNDIDPSVPRLEIFENLMTYKLHYLRQYKIV